MTRIQTVDANHLKKEKKRANKKIADNIEVVYELEHFEPHFDPSKPITWPEFEVKTPISYSVMLPFSLVYAKWAKFKRKIYELADEKKAKSQNVEFYDGGVTIKYRKVPLFFFEKLSDACEIIKKSAGSSESVEEMYNHSFNNVERYPTFINRFVADTWERCYNARAMRNRLKLVRQTIKEEIAKKIQAGKKIIKIIDLASGTGTNTLQIVAEYAKQNIDLQVLLIDINEAAITKAKEEAKKLGIESRVSTKISDVSKTGEIIKEFNPDIIQCIGLNDYFNDESSVDFIKSIYQNISKDSIFILDNIAPNIETDITLHILSWKLFFRTSAEMIAIAQKAGFTDIHIKIEPIKIHQLMILTK